MPPEKLVKIITSSCQNYLEIEKPLFESLDLLGCPRLFSGKRVMVKVNLMLGADPSLGKNTHPDFAAAIIKYIRMQGGEADVAESSGALGLTQACFIKSGMSHAVSKVKGGWVNLDAGPMRYYDLKGKKLRRIVLPKCLKEYDLIISAAKLKVHPLTGMTGAVKNVMGFAPGAVKPWIHHRHGRTPATLAEAILDLYLAFTPVISNIDGIICGEGGGSTTGNSKRGNFIAASDDGVALDAFCTDVMGLERAVSSICAAAEKRGFSPLSPEDWEVMGDGPRAFNDIPFEPSPLDKKALPVIGFLAYYLRDHAVRPYFSKGGCGDCNKCVKLCPTGSLTISNGRIRRKSSTCVGCYSCVFSCEKGMAKLKVAAWAKKMFWKKAAGLQSDYFLP